MTGERRTEPLPARGELVLPERELVPAVGGQRRVPAPDPVARDYLLLALRLDQHVPGLVDGYYGPRDLKAQVDLENLRPPARLAEDAAALRERVAAEVAEPDRRRWLDRQLVALETQAARLAGAAIPYVDEVIRCFDAPPTRLPPETYAEVRRELDGLLPGRGALLPRLEAWDARFVIPLDRVRAVVDALLPPIRAASLAHVPAPEGEALQVTLVTDQPWSGYNWYDGGLRSRVDLNVDLPIRPAALIDTLTHETYPGHHLEHAWKEERLVMELGRLEGTVLLINTPECFISEGLAELGRRFTLDQPTRVALLRTACVEAGLPASDDDLARQLAISASLHRLRGADGDAALLRHAEGRSRADLLAFLVEEALSSPERAEKRLAFIEHPLWRTYVFSYAGGEALLGAWCEAAGSEAGARGRFLRLLTEQLTPSGIREELETEPREDASPLNERRGTHRRPSARLR